MDDSASQAMESAKWGLRLWGTEQIIKLDPATRAAADGRIRSLLSESPILATDGVICGFLPLKSEPDLGPLLEALHVSGRRVALPEVTADDPMPIVEFDRVFGIRETRSGGLGTRVPRHGRAVEPAAVAAILVPGLAFDRKGRRLGRGGGHFDRLLDALPASTPRIGVAYEAQIAPEVPTEAHDRRVDWLCTERGLERLP